MLQQRVGGAVEALTIDETRHSLEPVSLLWPVLRLREDFRTLFRHEQRVFELRGQLPVACAHGPSVLFVECGIPFADVDHGFDREAHARMESFLAGLARGIVRDRRFLMEPRPSPWPTYSRTPRTRGLRQWPQWHRPMAEMGQPGVRASMAAYRQSKAHWVTARAVSLTSPIRNVSDWSPCQPLTIVVRSTLTMSPDLST